MSDILEIEEVLDTLTAKAEKAYDALNNEYHNMKAGRANPRILDKIVVEYYGQQTPINQLANISVPEARMMLISAWDVKALKEIEKAIIGANIGVTPNNDGKVIRLIFPELTQESRKNLVKDIKSSAENCKVNVRNSRRDANDTLRKYKKDNVLTEDDCIFGEKEVDKITQKFIEDIDKLAKDKENEVMSI